MFKNQLLNLLSLRFFSSSPAIYDYISLNFMLTFDRNRTSICNIIPILPDNVVEDDESFNLTIVEDTSIALPTPTIEGVIQDLNGMQIHRVTVQYREGFLNTADRR